MNGKKIFITGKAGMLGSSLSNILNSKDILKYNKNFDITNADVVNHILNDKKPDIIIHTAAYTDVDGCEKNIDKAYSVNTIGTQNLVNYCIGKDVLFIYISSTGIYGDSKQSRYTEFDSVNPTTIHHKTKYEAEKIIQNHLSKYLILRTGWLYGGDRLHNKNFVYKRFLEASGKEVIFSDNLQVGNPTYVDDLIHQMMVLIKQKQFGIFNCVNEADNISRYNYVEKIIELFSLKCVVKTASEDMFSRVAPVAKNESAVNYKLNLLDLNVMGNWKDSLSSYIKQLKGEF